MFQSLDVFQTAGAMARHAGSRQAVSAANVANADTPGYVAKRMKPFSQTVETTEAFSAKSTRPTHLAGAHFASSSTAPLQSGSSEPAPNGNAVSIEEEMLHSVEIMREHTRALAIYRHAMTVLRTTIGR